MQTMSRTEPFFIPVSILLAIILFPISALSADISGKSQTMLNARENIFKERIYRIYEYVDLSFTNAGDKGISLYASGWGRYTLDGPVDGDRIEGELSYAYVAVPVNSINSRVSLGRQFVFAGAASEQIDGIHISTQAGGFSASLFGGSPPELDMDNRGGDAIYGGRLSHHLKGKYEVGASYLKEDNDGSDFREEYGVDLWLKPLSRLSLNGMSSYNMVTSGWMEHTYRLTFSPSDSMRIHGEISQIDYAHFFNSTTSAAFSTLWLNPDESVNSGTVGMEFSLNSSITLSARYRMLDYQLSGSAGSFGAGITYAGENKLAGLSIDRAEGDTDVLRYTMYRAYGSYTRRNADITADLSTVDYDLKSAGIGRTLSATGALGYQPLKDLRASLEVTYEESPLFTSETRAMMKLNYRFGAI